MKNNIVFILIYFVLGLGTLNPAQAATIEFRTNSFVEAIYNLDIIANTESSGLPDLIVGDLIDLNGLGDLFAGQYYVSGIEHSFSSGEYRSSFTLDRQGGGIVGSDGNTDINLALVNYEFTSFEILQGDVLLTGFTFVKSIPEPSTLMLLFIGLSGLYVSMKTRRHKIQN